MSYATDALTNILRRIREDLRKHRDYTEGHRDGLAHALDIVQEEIDVAEELADKEDRRTAGGRMEREIERKYRLTPGSVSVKRVEVVR